MPERPKPRVVVDNSDAFDRARDIFLGLKAVASDPAGEAIWLLLDEAPAERRQHD